MKEQPVAIAGVCKGCLGHGWQWKAVPRVVPECDPPLWALSERSPLVNKVAVVCNDCGGIGVSPQRLGVVDTSFLGSPEADAAAMREIE